MTQVSRARGAARPPSLGGRLQALIMPPPSGETTLLFGVLTATVVVLILLGLLMTFSASFVRSALEEGDAFGIFRRQLLWCLVGVPVTVAVAVRDYRRWRPFVRPFMLVALLLAVVVVTPVGVKVAGARRWLDVGLFVFQPAELLKIAIPLFGADVLARRWGAIRSGDLRALLVPLVPLLAVVAVVIMAEPDLETAALLVAIGVAMLYVAGLPTRWLLASGAAALALGGIGIATVDFRAGRFAAWLDPMSDASVYGYQTLQGYYALGSGGWLGTGLGSGRGKWLYLPNAHTDFIFAIIGEELGLLGALLVLLLYVVIAVVGTRIATQAPDAFGRLLATGLVVGILLQAAINIGSVVGLLPVTGVTLPFVSFGGTSLVVTMISAGLLLSIARHTRPVEAKASAS